MNKSQLAFALCTIEPNAFVSDRILRLKYLPVPRQSWSRPLASRNCGTNGRVARRVTRSEGISSSRHRADFPRNLRHEGGARPLRFETPRPFGLYGVPWLSRHHRQPGRVPRYHDSPERGAPARIIPGEGGRDDDAKPTEVCYNTVQIVRNRQMLEGGRRLGPHSGSDPGVPGPERPAPGPRRIASVKSV